MNDLEQRTAMVVVAHPDDAEFGCAGTVAAWVREGWEVVYVICTDGAAGGPDEAIDVGPAARRRITAERHAEQRAACAILGVNTVCFLDYPDGCLMHTLELRRDIVRLLRRYRPTRVICQSPERVWTPQLVIGRYHPDHLAAGQSTLAAIYPASQNPWDFPELLDEGLRPHKVREVYIMGAPVINYAVDITATIDDKLAALRAHVGQLAAATDLEDRIRTWASERGEAYGMPYAEVFHRTENP